MKASTKTKVEEELAQIIPKDAACDFNQGLIELGAIVCVPNGAPKCDACPLSPLCFANQNGVQGELPVKSKAKARRIEKRTVFIFKDGENVAIRKRPKKGLLAGLYELPNIEGELTQEEALAYSRSIGLAPLRIEPVGEAKHIFSHVEWHMNGYRIPITEIPKRLAGEQPDEFILAEFEELKERYPIPNAFAAYKEFLDRWFEE